MQRLMRLSTHEDAKYFHIHKAVGVFTLAHFAFRMYLLATVGSMRFDRSPTTLACIGMHAFLHVTAFEFVLPRRRNMVYNIIFPEMRWHTLVFAYRALLCMLVTIYFPQYKFVNGVVVILTMIGADAATRRFSNTSTMMRGNAYPSYVSDAVVKWHNLFYAVSQMFATMNMLYYNEDAMFITLIPIQTAPLLMTLAKKGLLSQLGWHVLNTGTLLLGYYRGLVDYGPHIAWPTNAALTAFVAIGRIKFKCNKYLLWSVPIIVHWSMTMHQ